MFSFQKLTIPLIYTNKNENISPCFSLMSRDGDVCGSGGRSPPVSEFGTSCKLILPSTSTEEPMIITGCESEQHPKSYFGKQMAPFLLSNFMKHSKLWPTNAQLFHKLSHCYMFRHYRVILRQLEINTLPSYTSISNTAVGNTI